MKELFGIFAEPFKSGEFTRKELLMGAVVGPLVLVLLAVLAG